uniref:Tetratricopeptide repeat protein n=1 Tax=candidate division WOR-3 bacterium TaxID=2052148 RepID=A0A7V3ZXS6_UNCW3
MSQKKPSKSEVSNYSNDELFEFFKEALFEGNFDLAEKCIKELLRRVESNEVESEEEKIKYYKGMGIFQEMINNEELAREYFLKSLEIKPDDDEALNHLRKLSGLEDQSE